MELRNHSLTQRFQEFFDVDFAGSREKKEACYGIRYRVYCEEMEFEPAQLFPDKLERDEFDDDSLHCLVTHRSSGKPAGCVRLVSTTGRGGRNPLPFEKNCPGSVAPDFYRSRGLQRESMCEISRLAVEPQFRRRPGENVSPIGSEAAIDFSQQEMRTFSMIALAGFLAATALTDITGRTEVFAMMEPDMPPLLKAAGFEFQRAGHSLDYHGPRAPYFTRTEWVLKGMRPELRLLYNAIHKRIARTYRTYHAHESVKSYKTPG